MDEIELLFEKAQKRRVAREFPKVIVQRDVPLLIAESLIVTIGVVGILTDERSVCAESDCDS